MKALGIAIMTSDDCFLISLFRKKRVREFVIAKWPGNHIPTFKKKSSFQEELNDLVEEIAPSCSYPEIGFDKNSIRQHALDVLNERRRNVRNAFDYTKVGFTECFQFKRHTYVICH